MALSWNEIKDRALRFSKEWADTTREEADAKPFLDAFFNVFGITRKKIGTFEHKVKKISDADGYIDLLWKGTILIEMKSRGQNLDKAFQQAKDYTHGLKQNELPKYILVCDFDEFRLYDTEVQKTITFKLHELMDNVQHFGYIIGYQKKVYKEQDPANIKAAELMGKLHDRLEEIGYVGHPLEVYLVRILFCLFAEDTTIFHKEQFADYIVQRTNEDGSDLAAKIQELFQVLNTPVDKRFKNLDEQLNEFPYVNGKLFEEVLPTASFDSKMRQALLDCCYIDWSKISPAIFGSMFQSVMNPKERRNLGAHYTSETNILKLIKPLFLDELWAEFESIKTNKNKLAEFHKRISTLKFLDPACGCGNFLVITYRELRLLELEILRATYKSGQGVLDVSQIIWLDVDMMAGIEYEEFPARIAEVAMWLIDHQMNLMISNEFGQYFARLPLKKAAKIVHGNALRVDWEEVVSKKELSYIIGNPPFIGAAMKNNEQSAEMDFVFNKLSNNGKLDYVAAWYLLAAKFINKTRIKAAFVSTNSVTQGEQVGILWNELIKEYNMCIHFAHRTFNWKNDARGNAAVHCVIVGFANFEITNKYLFDYEDISGEATSYKVKNISPYLFDASNIIISKTRIPVCKTPLMIRGNIPYDDGNLLLNEDEKNELINSDSNVSRYIKKYGGAYEMLNNAWRYCLWFNDSFPPDLNKNSIIISRLKKCKEFREKSRSISVSSKSSTPYLFGDIRQPKSNYILFPRVSSSKRKYLPIDYFESDIILADSGYGLPNANLYMFGVLHSIMHNSWLRNIGGRLKSDYRYSNNIVYNNYPWPENPTEKQKQAIEDKAQKVLEVRASFPESSLADLYHPLTMPPALVKAHNELDKAVDAAYSKQDFSSEAKRMEFLFELYEKYTAGLFVKEKKKK
ncbi:MAG TPA: N-6 DNA methylase [Flavobacterium sp.]|jgi:hypothetical protein|nr:N-6 DNA methylase [Flavobacterium sp.]